MVFLILGACVSPPPAPQYESLEDCIPCFTDEEGRVYG